ncbi:hypothetical protein TNCV_2483981 [Trichonephila clavipes]|uniref:Uncharacterized protein n=1 Tax=Trichonephila clavipes TaxID=2585209 RepID=A0A8X7BB11_TRICX|nr:hypothetical protein TNCV_2483981 [Trichonephila clavipes]
MNSATLILPHSTPAKSVKLHDAGSRQRSCRMIMQHVKDALSICLTSVFTVKLKYYLWFRIAKSSLWVGNWASKLPAVMGFCLYSATLKRDISSRVECTSQSHEFVTRVVPPKPGFWDFMPLKNLLIKQWSLKLQDQRSVKSAGRERLMGLRAGAGDVGEYSFSSSIVLVT